MNTRPVRVALGIIGVLIVFFAGYFVYMQYQSGKINIPLLPDKPSQDDATPLVTTNDKGESTYSDKFYEEVKTKNIDELSKEAPELNNQLGIQETDAREKFVKDVLNNREPQNHLVEYTNKLSTSGVMILQGDYVTISNNSPTDLYVIKMDRVLVDTSKDIPDSLPIPNDKANLSVSEFVIVPGGMLSLNFDFLGEFNFKINNQLFVVNVVSSYE